MQQGGEQRLALLPKPRPTPVQSLSAPALGAVMCVMLMAQFAAIAQRAWPHRVSKIIQGANCPVVAPPGVPAKQGRSCSIHKRVTGKWFQKAEQGERLG